LLADEIHVATVEKMLFDADAVGMVADDAFARVALVRGEGGIIVFFNFYCGFLGIVGLGVVLGGLFGILRDFLISGCGYSI
jgi:hypothetical protein